MVHLYTPRKRQKAFGFSEVGIEMEHWAKMG